ncbi:MAG: hypothetical protein ACTHQQ_06690 [Solirubrobacteraceae bacterium]
MECSTALAPWEGQAGAREYRFAAREVGGALVSVAKGSSYRVAAEVARHKAGRVPPGQRGRRSAAKEGQLVANWVDVCGHFVCAGQLPRRWPDTIAVDSQNFGVNSGPNSGRGFRVLAAVGRDQAEPGKWAPVPRVWRLEPFARKDVAAWMAFFGALDGAPKVVVSDADNALALTIRSLFGDAVCHRQCEWQLGRKLRHHVPDEILAQRTHPITLAPWTPSTVSNAGTGSSTQSAPSTPVASTVRSDSRSNGLTPMARSPGPRSPPAIPTA